MKNRLLILSLFASSFVFADDVRQLAPTVVTATRVETNSFDLPVSIDVVEKKDLEGQLNMTLSESLIRIPGITAQNRTQMAQDPQISTRGFGARSTFGVRGIRVYVDDIPLSTPDGIATPGNIDIGTLKSIEVMRGPFSSLYGSSSGGVINLRTQNAPKDPEIGFNALYGSYNTDKELAYATGTTKGVEYLINYSKYSSDGYRYNSENEKEAATVKLKTDITSDTKLTMLFNWIDQKANDPGGLTVDEVYGPNRKMSSQNNINQKARVARDNKQVGFNLEHKLNDHNIVNLIAYVGERNNLQYLYSSAYSAAPPASPVSSTTGLGQSGRASAIARDFYGTDLRWTNSNDILGRPYQILAGISYGYQKDKRTDDMANNGEKSVNPTACAGSVNASIIANCYKLRDENNIAYNFDQYFQTQISATKNIDLHAGVRRTFITLKNEDFLVGSSTNTATTYKYLDGSGKITARKTTPVIGLVYKVSPTWNLYGNYGEGFETPTFIEMAYTDTSGGGPNFNLKPSTSENYELGTKFFIGDKSRASIAIFRTNTSNELVSDNSTSAYTSYKNAGKTQREGVEISAESSLPSNFDIYASYTYLDAQFKTPFTTLYSTSTASTTSYIWNGNKISGTYKEQLYGELSWKYPEFGFSTSFETRSNSKVFANDANTVSVAGYTVFNLRAGFEQKMQGWRLTEYLRLENLTDKDYIGSIKNNENTGRYFEPSAGRNYLVGVSASYQFK